jgi:hypothetical protein
MFTKSEMPPDILLFEQVDEINRSISRVRSFLREKVGINSTDDLSMIRSQVEDISSGAPSSGACVSGWRMRLCVPKTLFELMT